MKEIFEVLLDCIESQSYLKAFRTLSSVIDEHDDFGDGLSLEEKTELDVLYSCLHIIVSESGGDSGFAGGISQTVGIYERLSLLLIKKLLGDKSAGKEVEMLMFCRDAIRQLRMN